MDPLLLECLLEVFNQPGAMHILTDYRRRIRQASEDNHVLPVICNDYMALWGDPTEEKELPLIEAAAEVGCEYFCIQNCSSGGCGSRNGDF